LADIKNEEDRKPMIARGPTPLFCAYTTPKHKMLPKAFFRSPNLSMVRHRLSLIYSLRFLFVFGEKQQVVFTRSGVAIALLKKHPQPQPSPGI